MWKKKLMQEIQKANNKTNRKTKQTMEALSRSLGRLAVVWLEPQGVGVVVCVLCVCVCAYTWLIRATLVYNIHTAYFFLTIFFLLFPSLSCACASARQRSPCIHWSRLLLTYV